MAQSDPQATDPRPALIGGKYRVVRTLGEGGMGAVYEAENTWTRRRVAVKVMHPDNADNPAFVQRFMREAQATSQLDHPNVVTVLDMGQEQPGGGFFIVQEFLTGQDLRARLKSVHRLSPREALDIVLPVMEGLATAHARGIVHRDLKPENIFLAETPRGVVPKVIDFGIAKVTGPEGDGMLRTSTGQVIGTPCYMSPEQAAGESDVDARSDVWSLGVVLYEMVSGGLPFTADRFGRLVADIIMGSPRPLALVAPHLPRTLVDVIHGALRPRDERHATMMAFHSALSAVRADADATPDVPWVPPPAPVSAEPRTTAAAGRQTPVDSLGPVLESGREASVVLASDPPPPEVRGSTGLHWSGRTRPPVEHTMRRWVAVALGAAAVVGVGVGVRLSMGTPTVTRSTGVHTVQDASAVTPTTAITPEAFVPQPVPVPVATPVVPPVATAVVLAPPAQETTQAVPDAGVVPTGLHPVAVTPHTVARHPGPRPHPPQGHRNGGHGLPGENFEAE